MIIKNKSFRKLPHLLFLVYPKKENVYCENFYGSYSTLASARTACASDNNCGAVYDAACDDTGYKLCPKNFVEKACQSPSCTSCIYTKNGKIG